MLKRFLNIFYLCVFALLFQGCIGKGEVDGKKLGLPASAKGSSGGIAPAPAILTLEAITEANHGAILAGTTKTLRYRLTNISNLLSENISSTVFGDFSFQGGGAFPGATGTCTSTLASKESCEIAIDYSSASSGEDSYAWNVSYSISNVAKNVSFGLYGLSLDRITILTILDPVSAQSNDNTPTISFNNAVEGTNVNFYNDAFCTVPVFSAIVTDDGTAQVTAPALPDGSYTFFANQSILGTTSLCSLVSDNLVIDTQKPNPPANIFHSSDAAPSASNTLNFDAGVDNGPAGVSHFEMAVSTSKSSADVIAGADWTNIGNTTSGRLTGLTLTTGQTYYSLIRLVDFAGNISDERASFGWQYQPITPSSIPSGLSLWLDGGDPATHFQNIECTKRVQETNQPVSCIQDKSGNNNHAINNEAFVISSWTATADAKASGQLSDDYKASKVIDGTKTGDLTHNWLHLSTTSKLNIQYSSSTSIKAKGIRIYPSHNSGTALDGIKNFRVYGSNNIADYLDVNYLNAPTVTMTALHPDPLPFVAIQHPKTTDTAEPQDFYFTLNEQSFRYYIIYVDSIFGNYAGIGEVELLKEADIITSTIPWPASATVQASGEEALAGETALKAIDGVNQLNNPRYSWLAKNPVFQKTARLNIQYSNISSITAKGIRINNAEEFGVGKNGIKDFEVYGSNSINDYNETNPSIVSGTMTFLGSYSANRRALNSIASDDQDFYFTANNTAYQFYILRITSSHDLGAGLDEVELLVQSGSVFSTITWPGTADVKASAETIPNTANKVIDGVKAVNSPRRGWYHQSSATGKLNLQYDQDSRVVAHGIRVSNAQRLNESIGGIKDFSIYGSNSVSDFNNIDHATVTSTMNLLGTYTAAKRPFPGLVANHQDFIFTSNKTPYQYYIIKVDSSYDSIIGVDEVTLLQQTGIPNTGISETNSKGISSISLNHSYMDLLNDVDLEKASVFIVKRTNGKSVLLGNKLSSTDNIIHAGEGDTNDQLKVQKGSQDLSNPTDPFGLSQSIVQNQWNAGIFMISSSGLKTESNPQEASALATSVFNATQVANKAVDNTKTGLGWISQFDSVPPMEPQKLNIDYGSEVVAKGINLTNGHFNGSSVGHGARSIHIYGSNTLADFLDTAYASVPPSLTLLGSFVANPYSEDSNGAIAQNFDFAGNTTAYRYYIIRIDDNFSGNGYISIHEVEIRREAGNDINFFEGGVDITDPVKNTVKSTDSLEINRIGGSLSEKLNGEIGEVIIYDRDLTPAERLQIENYLDSKWGL